MPAFGSSARTGPAAFGTDPAYTPPKAARARTTQDRIAKAERETDDHRLYQRQKQIDYGKNTSGYLNYISEVSVDRRTNKDPWTPDIHKKYPKRVWDVTVRTWRRQLHKYDLDSTNSLFGGSSQAVSPDASPNLNTSIDSEDGLIDAISDAIQKFQQDERDKPGYETGEDFPLDDALRTFDNQVELSAYAGNSNSSDMSTYSSAPSYTYSLFGEDSNCSVDSATSSNGSIYSDAMTLDYMSENSCDSFSAMGMTPIAMLGSPFSFSSPQSSASQHSVATNTPISSSSASQHYSSPYGAIGVPKFPNLNAFASNNASSSSSSSSVPFSPQPFRLNSSAGIPKANRGSENMENKTSNIWA